jgi:hypothetical protein
MVSPIGGDGDADDNHHRHAWQLLHKFRLHPALAPKVSSGLSDQCRLLAQCAALATHLPCPVVVAMVAVVCFDFGSNKHAARRHIESRSRRRMNERGEAEC